MMFDLESYRKLCQDAAVTIQFEEVASAIEAQITLVGDARELPQFQRDQLEQHGRAALDLLNGRKTDPNQLLGSLKTFLAQPSIPDDAYDALDKWFVEVAYSGEVIPSALESELLDSVKLLRTRCPSAAAISERVEDIKKRTQRITLFSKSSVRPSETVRSAIGLSYIVRSLPLDEGTTSSLLAPITAAKETGQLRSTQPLEQLLRDGLAEYHAIVERTGDVRLSQEQSYELQINLFGARAAIEENKALPDELHDSFLGRLNLLDERFDRVRYMSFTAVFKQVFEPRLADLEVEADRSLEFQAIEDECDTLLTKSKRGRPGIDRISRYHQDIVAKKIEDIRQILRRRQQDKEALTRGLRLIEERVAALDAMRLLTRPAIIRVQHELMLCTQWASGTDQSQLPHARRLKDACQGLWELVDQRYGGYLRQLDEGIAAFADRVQTLTDFRTGFNELRELEHSIKDSDDGLKHGDRNRFLRQFGDVQRSFFRRLNDSAAIRAEFARLDDRLAHVARNLRRYSNLDEIDSEVRQLGFRVGRARLSEPDERELVSQMRKTYARLGGLKRRREEYLAERAANQTATFNELKVTITECHEKAVSDSGNPSSWAALIEADQELRAAGILSPDQRATLRHELDAAFNAIKEKRAEFARQASIVYVEYLDATQNIFQPLERTSPPPTREDAFEAIEEIKPLRTRLREERRLLRAQREELFGSLRVISDAISEILDKASAAMEKNFIHFRRRLEQLEKNVQDADDGARLRAAIEEHKALYADLRAGEVSLEGRREFRSALEHLWTMISDKRQAASIPKLDVRRLDETLAQLERQGHFLWMSSIPNLR